MTIKIGARPRKNTALYVRTHVCRNERAHTYGRGPLLLARTNVHAFFTAVAHGTHLLAVWEGDSR